MDDRDIRIANLRYAIHFFGGAAALAEAADCSKKYLEQIEAGFKGQKDKNPRKPGDVIAKKVAKALHKEPFWLSQPHPELWAQMDNLPVETMPSRQKKQEEIVIRQYETGGSMGDGLELRDQPGVIYSWSVNTEWLQKNIKSRTAATNLCIVTGFGDSMRPMFNPGDPLIIDTGIITVDFDAVYFFRVGKEGFIKRLQRVPGKGLLAISENQAYRDWIIDETMDFEVFGRVLKVWCSEEF